MKSLNSVLIEGVVNPSSVNMLNLGKYKGVWCFTLRNESLDEVMCTVERDHAVRRLWEITDSGERKVPLMVRVVGKLQRDDCDMSIAVEHVELLAYSRAAQMGVADE